ncbi:FxsA family protein [Candidatus Pelagibacter sp.]|nr:FxsA family protein [Candidatus Pelagibacter sp.]
MNPVLLSIILIPILEIYLFIKIGSQIGAFNTILLIFVTAIIGVYYAKYEGLNTIKSGFAQIIKKQTPVYEIISGAAITFAAILLILPGFATDVFGFLLIFPITRKLIFGNFSSKFKKEKPKKNNFIDGEFEDIKDNNDDRKI